MSIEQRIADILDLAAQEGIVLPLPVELIVVYELAGHTVDLATGEVTLHGAEQRFAPGAALYVQQRQEGSHDGE